MHVRPGLALGIAVTCTLGLVSAPAPAQEPELTLERIMAHPDWLGRAPEDAYWADDGESIYFERKREGEEIRDLYELELDGTVRKVEDGERGAISVPGGDWSRDRTRKVYARAGDVYLRDVSTGEVRQLTRTAAEERNPFFLADESRVAFERGEAVFVRDLASGLESQPAELVAEEDPEEEEAEEEAEEGYLARQQEDLFQIVREVEARERARRERERAERSGDPTRPPLPWYLGEDVEVAGASLSPSGDWMLVAVAPDEREEGKRDLMPEYVTETGYVETEEVRPKVGTGDGRGERLLLLDLRTHELHELDWAALPGIDHDPLAELRAAAEAMKRPSSDRRPERAERVEGSAEESSASVEEGEDGVDEEPVEEEIRGEQAEEAEEEPELRAVQTGPVVWNDDGTRVAVLVFSVDNKDRWIATVDLEHGRLVPVHRLHDPAWINWAFHEAGWLPDGDTLWYLSEEDGYSHLYLEDLGQASSRRRLTRGEFVVSDVTLSPDGRWFYLRANREHPGVWEVYRVPAAGTPDALERVTTLDDHVDYVLAPDGERLLLRHSTAIRPPELYVQPASPGALSEPERLTETVSEAYRAFDWRPPELVAVPSGHGAPQPVRARLYLPRGHDPARAEPYPAVIFVHGAGYLQDAYDGWSYYFREHMFHELLTRRGYVVLDMDYRGSAGYGRDWRTAIYRHMGEPELQDLLDGIAWMAEEQNVDPERVGVYGGSYGGFMTLMALFKEPGTFAAGASLRPVTDWAHYNHPYTSNILNTPEVDPEAYERSSPIELADGLADPLVILHGMLDDNVLVQDTVRLTQRLIELEKEDWWVALYPIEPHGFREPSSWLDAYRRILALMEEEVRGVE